jgi:peptidoglycan/LPS O-acetylase OafA/YrhL
MTGVSDPAHQTTRRGLPAVRIGVLAGLTGLMCCVGPSVLALIGVISAGTAFTWATDLYDGYAWFFRLGGLLLLVLLLMWSLRRRNQCSLGGAKKNWKRLLIAFGAALATYGILYGVTTWLGTFA